MTFSSTWRFAPRCSGMYKLSTSANRIRTFRFPSGSSRDAAMAASTPAPALDHLAYRLVTDGPKPNDAFDALCGLPVRVRRDGLRQNNGFHARADTLTIGKLECSIKAVAIRTGLLVQVAPPLER